MKVDGHFPLVKKLLIFFLIFSYHHKEIKLAISIQLFIKIFNRPEYKYLKIWDRKFDFFRNLFLFIFVIF